MPTWFEGSGEIQCTLQRVKDAFENHGEHYVGVVRLMPGMSRVELVEQGSDSVVIKTDEGVMTRTNISKRFETDIVVVEFDEKYQAGSKVTTTAHFLDEFRPTETGVTHRTVISDLKAPGFLGFFYRTFGRSSMGNAFLKAYKSYFETPPQP